MSEPTCLCPCHGPAGESVRHTVPCCWPPDEAPEPADQTRADVGLSEGERAEILRAGFCAYDHLLNRDPALAAFERILAGRLAAERAEHAARAEAAEATVARVAALCEQIIEVHSHVVMDTPKDRALHDRAVAVFRTSLRAALDGERP